MAQIGLFFLLDVFGASDRPWACAGAARPPATQPFFTAFCQVC